MKAREEVRVSTLRLLLASLRREIVARTDRKHRLQGQALTEADVLSLLRRDAGQRTEAEQIYRQAGRVELADKEAAERGIIQGYLPAELDASAIRQRVEAIKTESGATEFRALMPLAMRALRGQADGALVQRVVRELTGA